MKFHLIGTGGVFSDRLSPCFVLDDMILFEIPNGAVKKIRQSKISLNDISLCLLSHFHADHSFDFPFLLLEKNQTKSRPLTVVGPSGLRNYLYSLCTLAYPTLDWDTIFSHVIESFIECSEVSQVITWNGYVIHAQSVEHDPAGCCGYAVTSPSNLTFAYTGDCCICSGARWLASHSDYCCADMNSFTPSATHMGFSDLLELSELTSGHLLAVHTPDELPSDFLASPVLFPKDGEVYMVPDTSKPHSFTKSTI